MRDPLNGFASLRTRPPRATVAERPERRTCLQCGAVLASDNPGPYCRPCAFGEVDVPAWAVTLAPACDTAMLNMLARVVAPGTAYETTEWQVVVSAFVATGAQQAPITREGMTHEAVYKALARAIEMLGERTCKARRIGGVAYLERR